MWEFTKIFSSTDSLFKFLFVGGVSMVFIALFYPLQKQHELELQENQLNLEFAQIEHKIRKITKDVTSLTEESTSTEQLIQDLYTKFSSTKSLAKRNEIESKVTTIEKNFNEKVELLAVKVNLIQSEDINRLYKEKEINILKEQVDTYKSYTRWLILIGISIGLFGIIGWIQSTFLSEQIKRQQLTKTDLELDATYPNRIKIQEEEVTEKKESTPSPATSSQSE